MAAQVLSFFQRSPRYQPGPSDWTQQELAEFYRVESALIRAGIRVGTDRGLSDENEPWFVFYRSDDGDVVMHFARIDGQYIIAGPAYEEIARGFDFTQLVRNMVERHPLIKRPERGSNIAIHPAALLVAIVGTAFFKSGEARAETGAGTAPQGANRPALLSSSSPAGITGGAAASAVAVTGVSVQVPVSQAVLILAAAMMAADIKVDSNTVSPAANDAIAAAAAALDFSSASRDIAPATAAKGVVGTGHSVATPTPTETVSSVLALIALLSTLPGKARATDHTDSVIAYAGGADGFAAPPLATPPAVQWSIDVRFASGGLAEVEAVQLVRSLVGDDVQRVAVIQVEKLPQVLSELIDRGAHYTVPNSEVVGPIDVAPPAPTPAPVSPPEAPPVSGDMTPPTSGTPSSPPPADVLTPVPVTATPAPTQTLPTAPIETPAPKPGLPAFSGFASQELVKQFVEYFVTHTEQVSIMVQGLQVVIFDTRVTTNAQAIDHLTSMSFTFFDGTSVSLIGAQSAFLHHDGLT